MNIEIRTETCGFYDLEEGDHIIYRGDLHRVFMVHTTGSSYAHVGQHHTVFPDSGPFTRIVVEVK